MIFKEIKSFEEAEQYLYDMPRFTSKHTIKETRKFLEEMGSPDLSMKIIHVAGTNGKGSTCAYLDSVLREAGIHTGLFTSPHLVDVCERIKVDGKDISHEEFFEAFMEIYDRIDFDTLKKGGDAYHPTFFEYLFFMAMYVFKKAGVEWCILETGLGGLLDATNSIKTKEAAVITRIDLDHTEYLGNTKAEIAVQKAGIIAPGKPVVYSDYVPEASEAILKEAKRLKSGDCYAAGPSQIKVLTNLPEKVDFSLLDGYYKYVSLCLDTIAKYQAENALLAVKAIEAAHLTERITPSILRDGLYKCHWAGRMEEVLPDVFVDGAHNPDGIRAFLDTAKQQAGAGKAWLIFGVVGDKDHLSMIREIADSGLFEKIVITSLHSARGADPKKIAREFEEQLRKDEENILSVSADPEDALDMMLKERKKTAADGPAPRIYIAGSLYLVGEIKDICENNRIE